jgi:hypothetical protein
MPEIPRDINSFRSSTRHAVAISDFDPFEGRSRRARRTQRSCGREGGPPYHSTEALEPEEGDASRAGTSSGSFS